MKVQSDDALDALLTEDTEEGRRTRELVLHNTELNSASPPSSTICSSPDLSPETSLEGFGAVQREGPRSEDPEQGSVVAAGHNSPLRNVSSNLKREAPPHMESYMNP